MNTLINMDPWSLFDDIFGSASSSFRTMRARAAGRFPPANVYRDDDAVMIELQLPGKTAQDVELTLEAQSVVIADKPAEAPAADGKPSAHRAPAWGRRIELPFHVNVEKACAKFDNGILRIQLPKAEATGVRKIAIQ